MYYLDRYIMMSEDCIIKRDLPTRNVIINFLFQDVADKRGNQETLLDEMNNKYYYFTRTKGLFRICYPKEKPKSGMF